MRRKTALVVLLAALAGLGAVSEGWAAREAKGKAGEEASEGDMEARRLLGKAKDLLQVQETERAVKMLESILEQYPKSGVRYEACLELGRHFLAAREQVKAISFFNQLRSLEQDGKELTGPERELYLEAMYLAGVAYFQIRQYGSAFPILRKITTEYPNSVWANQAYYYIGMCHFAQQNWNKTIEALGLVGTFVDPDSPTVQYVEAGRRFYVKVQDADLPVLASLGRQIVVSLETPRGDKEKVECIPLVADSDVFIGSIPTDVALAKPGDNVLQVIGGDTITVRYVDENGEEGKANVSRESVVKVVSTASLTFTLGDGESTAAASFLDQPLVVLLQDTDLDKGDGADTAEVTLVSRYKEEEPSDEGTTKAVDLAKLLQEERDRYAIRDRVTVKLVEVGALPAHSGRFLGRVMVVPPKPDVPVDQTDATLTAMVDDEIVATFEDVLHVGGESPRAVEARIPVIGEIDNQPKASQDVVFDVVVKSKKNLVEGQAYLELARIFKSMGLVRGAKEKAQEGLERVDFIIRTRTPIPSALKQDAFKIKWELHVAADDLASAIATCRLFNQLFPDSPFVDEALMGIGKIRLENRQYPEALSVFQQVLGLPKSEAKAEAQFLIADITEKTSKPGSEAAIQQFKLCAERYPESEFAGASLAKLVDYHVDTKDYVQADTLLEQVFQDYPDAKFLDSMLLKWVLVAYRSGNYAKASEKCSQLIFEYPESPYAEKAKQIMPKIEGQLKKTQEKAP